MNNRNVQDIITKKLLEEATSEELRFLEDWRNESDQNEALYQEYATIWNATANYPSIDFQPGVEAAYQKHLEILASEEEQKENTKVVELQHTEPSKKTEYKPVFRIFTLRRMAGIAAIMVMAIGALFLFNVMTTTTYNAENGVLFVSLEDGTNIWLDESSTISYKRGYNVSHRDISIQGKAFFDVNRNENIPFNIEAGDMNVSVLGTSFTVDTKNNSNSVAVRTGLVKVASAQGSIQLTADEKVDIINNNFEKGITTSEDISWRNKDLSFNSAPINQVIADVNLFHNEKLLLKSTNDGLDCPFTSRSLSNTSLENIIEVLRVTYDLQVENLDEEKFLLTISDCK